jgi:hypothetical protein
MNYQTEQAKLNYLLASTDKKGCIKLAIAHNFNLDISLPVSEMRSLLSEAILPTVHLHKK